jgi:tetratricopeptide (TPR) repeat protein
MPGRHKIALISLVFAVMLSGCSGNRTNYTALFAQQYEKKSVIERASAAIMAGKYEAASLELNQNLMANVTDARLHFLNGLAYHLKSFEGNFNNLLLAQHGYRVALRLDPSNALYLRQLARLEEELGNFRESLRYQAEVALLNPSSKFDRKLTARKAYLSGLFKQSLGLYEAIITETPDDYDARQGAALAAAALGDPERAGVHLQALSKARSPIENLAAVKNRVDAWTNYRKFGKAVLQRASSAQTPPEQSKEAKNEKTIVFDIMFIELSRMVSTRQGINLFEGLALTLGQDTTGTSGLSRIAEQVDTRGTLTETITTAIHVPAITYSLNIFNASESRAEIVSNPSLVATVGKESVLFSGLKILAAHSSSDNSNTIQFEDDVGLTLTLTPEILDNGQIALAMTVEQSTLTAPNTSLSTFSLRIDVAKTNASINANIGFDQTLVIGGLNQRIERRKSSGVPVLGDVPVAENVFSSSTKQKLDHSVLILVTPRAAENLMERENSAAPTTTVRETEEILLEGYLAAIGVEPGISKLDQDFSKADDKRLIRVQDLPKATWFTRDELEKILKQAHF